MNWKSKGFAASDIFNASGTHFNTLAWEVFNFQLENNAIYRQYCQALGFKWVPEMPFSQIPFLPISFFKTHDVAAFQGEASIVFTSSGTTGTATSKHPVKELAIYETSFFKGFELFYGHPENYAFLCLLPSYLEREGSSLIYMAEQLVQFSKDSDSGFYLNAHSGMADILQKREKEVKKTVLLGVTYALLDFADTLPMPLENTIIMETGGMKGRRMELTRAEVHQQLKAAFGVKNIHSEYGMTELLSQAYSFGNGLFKCPPWMRVLVRAEDDPFDIRTEGAGLLCIIDLANYYSCAFIETADVGRVFADGSFEVLGRMDNSDLRGCSLLVT